MERRKFDSEEQKDALIPDLRVYSRQAYLEKREAKKLDELEQALRDEETLFAVRIFPLRADFHAEDAVILSCVPGGGCGGFWQNVCGIASMFKLVEAGGAGAGPARRGDPLCGASYIELLQATPCKYGRGSVPCLVLRLGKRVESYWSMQSMREGQEAGGAGAGPAR